MKHDMIEINRFEKNDSWSSVVKIKSVVRIKRYDNVRELEFALTGKEARALCEALFLFLSADPNERYSDDFFRTVIKPVSEQGGEPLSSRG